MILRCTNKLLAVIGSPLADPAPAPDAEDWYANLLWFGRRKCLLATHSGTLFTIFEAHVTASGLRATRQLITGLISRELGSEDLPPATFGILDEQELHLARTADRSVLGCMNDMAFLCQHVIAGSGGLARTDLADLNRSLRRNINSARDYRPPIELTRPGRLTPCLVESGTGNRRRRSVINQLVAAARVTALCASLGSVTCPCRVVPH